LWVDADNNLWVDSKEELYLTEAVELAMDCCLIDRVAAAAVVVQHLGLGGHAAIILTE
jgi:hypothetical protein